jgi:hypothetical protein
MKRFLLIISTVFITSLVQGQIADWENYNIQENGFIKDAMPTGQFSSGGVVLNNTYVNDPLYPYWTGWILSAGNDTDTPGFINEHSARPGEGADGSDNYAVTYVVGESIIKFDDYSIPRKFTAISITNNTYAYKSMLEGDQFAKRFGGEDGNDKDFFILTIKGYNDGVVMNDSIDFVLADYRFDNNDEDYILQDWEAIDVSKIGDADSLSLRLFSSDNSSFGMNTPAYICLDNITWQTVSNVSSIDDDGFYLVSNLITNSLSINAPEFTRYIIYNRNGRTVKHGSLIKGLNNLNLAELGTGLYFVKINNRNYSSKAFSIIK